jgi:predicted O-methyltransferase YrrM
MSAEPTLVTARHFDYLRDHTEAEEPLLAALKEEAAAAGIPRIWISHAQARLMQVLLRAAGAREVVEVGTLAGYSAIAMARALPADGRVRTIELSGRHAAFARDQIERAGLAERIEVHQGRGADVLPGFEARSADVAFLDADKSSYGLYLEECLRIVRPGGLVLVDNAFAFGQLFDAEVNEGEVAAVRAFNELAAGHPGYDGVIVPIGDGLWVGTVRGE